MAAAKVADKDDMEYLRQEIKNAMDSQPLGVSCEQAPPPPKPYGEKELSQAKILSFYQKLLDATVREGEKIETWLMDVSGSFISRSAAAVAEASIIVAPLTPGSATPRLLGGDDERRVAEYEARKADVFRRMIEQSKLRDECRKKLPACSTDGKSYDLREAIRRRDHQYLLWGEASYYIPWTDLLKDPPPEMSGEIGTWGGIKSWPYGAEAFYTWLKRDIIEYGSTPPGGEGYARQGLQKASNDNRYQDFTIDRLAPLRQLNENNSRKIEATNQLNRYSQMSDQVLANPARAGQLEQALTQKRR